MKKHGGNQVAMLHVSYIEAITYKVKVKLVPKFSKDSPYFAKSVAKRRRKNAIAKQSRKRNRNT